MAIRNYVGARYVPKLANPVEWQANTSYEAMVIVTYNNSSYTSKIPVPPTVGNPANNPQYWALTGNYNAQVEQYRQETENYTAQVEQYRQETENYNAQVEQYRKETENVKINYSKCFNTATNMIADTSLTEGMIVKTLGYNKIADNGGAFYKIYNTKEQNREHYENLSNGKYALLIPNWYITPEMFGAIGDGVTDDTDAIQNAINYGVSYWHGLAIILRGVTYKVTRPLTLSNGVRLMGINTKMYAGNFGYTTILAKFADNNKLPILNASSNDEDDYGYTSPEIRYEEIYVSDLTLGGNAFCGIKCKAFSSKFENITISDCKVGIHAFSTFCTYFEKISCTHCEIGMICHDTHSNATIEKCWFNYGLSILNDTDLSQIVNETISILETTKKTGLVVIHGEISIIKSNFEAYYYGVFAQGKGSVYGNGVNVEQICVGGAAFSDSADTGANCFNIKGLTCWNGKEFGGCIAKPNYRGIYHIESDKIKPDNFADSNFHPRGVLTLNFLDTEKYINISSIAGITNPVITNNYTRFDKHGNIIVDFVLSNYDNQDLSVAPFINFANLSDSGFDGLSGNTPIIGTNLRYNHRWHSITNLDGGFVELPKNTRYTFIAKYSPV